MIIQSVPLTQILPLRQQLLRPHLSVDECRFALDDHPQATHFGAFLDDRLVGCCSIAPSEFPHNPLTQSWRLRMMATIDGVRHRGVGRRLLLAAEQAARSAAAGCVWCNARVSAQGFYQKLGYQIIGEPFPVEHIGPHVVMVKYFSAD